jgi:hypothetical protein
MGVFFLYSAEEQRYKADIYHPLIEGKVGWVIQA